MDLVRADGAVKMSLSTGNVFGFVDSQLGKPRSTTAFARGQVKDMPTAAAEAAAAAATAAAAAATPTSGGNDCNDDKAAEAVVQVAAISMASLERMSADYPGIAVKLMKVLLRQSSLELSNS